MTDEAKGLWLGSILLRLPITSYCFLVLPITPSVSCSWLDALNTPSSKLPLSPTVSLRLPLSATRLSLLLNPHPKYKTALLDHKGAFTTDTCGPSTFATPSHPSSCSSGRNYLAPELSRDIDVTDPSVLFTKASGRNEEGGRLSPAAGSTQVEVGGTHLDPTNWMASGVFASTGLYDPYKSYCMRVSEDIYSTSPKLLKGWRLTMAQCGTENEPSGSAFSPNSGFNMERFKWGYVWRATPGYVMAD